jgi:nicotinamidase-related amidase
VKAAARELRIAARPGEFVCRSDQTALMLIDMQRDFIEPGGYGESLGNDVSLLAQAVRPAARLLRWAREQGLLVVHTRESHAPDLSDCPPAKRLRGAPSRRIGDVGPMGRILVRGEPGNAIVDAVAPIAGEWQIDKPGKGAFCATGLGERLGARGIRQLILGGVTTEVCVQTTMREANDRGYDCLLVDEATASYFPEFKQATLRMIVAQGGIVGWVAGIEQVLRPSIQGLSSDQESPP